MQMESPRDHHFHHHDVDMKDSGQKSPNFNIFPESNAEDVPFVLDISLIDETYQYNEIMQNGGFQVHVRSGMISVTNKEIEADVENLLFLNKDEDYADTNSNPDHHGNQMNHHENNNQSSNNKNNDDNFNINELILL